MLAKLSRGSELSLFSQLPLVPYFSAALLMTADCSGQVRVTSTAAGDSCAQFEIKISQISGRRRLDSDRHLAFSTGDKPADLQAWKTRSLVSLCRAMRSLEVEQLRSSSPKVFFRDVLHAMQVRVRSQLCSRNCRHSVIRSSEFVNFSPSFFMALQIGNLYHVCGNVNDSVLARVRASDCSKNDPTCRFIM